MKLTWFGGTALRVYLGGEIVVIDPDAARLEIDQGELLGGADRVIAFDDDIRAIDPLTWRPRSVVRAMDEGPPTELLRIGHNGLLLTASGEPPLVLLGPGDPPSFGRWADGAVIVLIWSRETRSAEISTLLRAARPRLIALALDEPKLDRILAQLTVHLDGVSLVSLEPGLALEV